MKGWLDRFTAVVDDVGAALMGLMMFVTFAQVVFRYVLRMPLSWSEEAARYLLIWMTMVGAASALATGEHIDIDTFVNLMPLPVREVLWQVRNSMVGLFLVVIGWYGLSFARVNSCQYSPTITWLSMYWPCAALPFGAALMVVYALRDVIRGFKGRR